MDLLTTAMLSGLVFAFIDTILVNFVKFKSKSLKNEAMMSTFIQRFGTGFVIPFVTLPMHHALTGALIAFVFSLPLAIHLRMKAPLMGAVLGFIVGWFT